MALTFTTASINTSTPHKTKIKRSGQKEKLGAVTSADCVFLHTMKRVQLLLKTEIDDKMAVHFFPPVETDDSRKQFFGHFLTLIVSAHLFSELFILF